MSHEHRHEATTRVAAAGSAVVAAVATGIAVATQLVGVLRADVTVSGTRGAGLVPVAFLSLALLCTVVGVAGSGANVRRRSLWVAAAMLAPVALYLLPVWWLSGPLVIGCVGAGTAAALIGHRQRCREVRAVVGRSA